MAATIRDITKMTGLSLATVSKYLNGGNVLPENRALIEQAIRELHYEVNEVARGLAKNKTKTIGVLIHHLDNIFASTITVSYTHLDVYKRQDQRGKEGRGKLSEVFTPPSLNVRESARKEEIMEKEIVSTDQAPGCLLYTSRCV